MAYIPTEWETGDVITAAKLNNIEDGIVANEEAIDSLEEEVASDIYEMEGIITVNQQFVPQGFTLTSGDVAEIPLHKIVKMKSMISVGGQTDVIEMTGILSSHNLGTVVGSENYHFATVLFLNAKIYYASVYYTVTNSTWGTTMIELTRADAQ